MRRNLILAFLLPFVLAALFVFSLSGYLAYREIENPFATFDFIFAAWITLYTLLAYILILWLGVDVLGKTKFTKLGWLGPSLFKDCAFGLAGMLAASLATFSFGWIFGAWTFAQFIEMETNVPFAQRGMFLLIGLNAGLIEESLFRGFTQPVLAKRFGVPVAIIITSLLFALYHLQFRPMGFAGKFILGLVYGVMRMKDKPLIRASISHLGTWLIIGTL